MAQNIARNRMAAFVTRVFRHTKLVNIADLMNYFPMMSDGAVRKRLKACAIPARSIGTGTGMTLTYFYLPFIYLSFLMHCCCCFSIQFSRLVATCSKRSTSIGRRVAWLDHSRNGLCVRLDALCSASFAAKRHRTFDTLVWTIGIVAQRHSTKSSGISFFFFF